MCAAASPVGLGLQAAALQPQPAAGHASVSCGEGTATLQRAAVHMAAGCSLLLVCRGSKQGWGCLGELLSAQLQAAASRWSAEAAC